MTQATREKPKNCTAAPDADVALIERELDLFFNRLPAISGLLKALTNLPIQLVLESRDSRRRWLLDLASEPMQVHSGSRTIEGSCALAATAEDLDHLLSGRLPFTQGFSQRRLLIGGSMYHLLRFYCLLTLTPVLFAEHRFGNGRRPTWIQKGLGRFFGWIVAWLGALVGRVLRRVPREDRLYAIGALARGVSRCAPGIQPTSAQKPPPARQEHPLERPKASWIYRASMGLLAFVLAISGIKIGVFRYKLGLDFDLFEVLKRLSNTIHDRAV